MADLDLAVQNEWELEIVRGGGALSTSVWYKGRITKYSVGVDTSGQRKTTITTSGYVSKLREIIINSQQIAAGQTVKQAVQTILDTYVTPATRIRYHADDIVGAYALVGALELRNVDVLSTFHKLAMLQGSTEWGVTEGGTSTTAAPAFYFKAEAAAASETAVFMLGNSLAMDTGGSFEGAYNTVYVLGGLVSNAAITGSANDATAVNTYGARSIRVMWAALQHATDATRLATNYVSFYKDGAGVYCACLENPTSRLEPDRTSDSYGTGTPVIPATPKAQWWGDSSKLTEHWQTIGYTYEPGCAIRFKACGCGGLPPTTQEALTTRLFDSVDALANMIQHITAGGGGGAPTDAQYVTLAVNATLTQERVLAGTANQITVTDGGAGGNVTLAAPQDLHSGAEPSFAGMTLGTQELNLAAQTPTQLNADANDYAFAGATTSTGTVYRLDAAGAARTITGIAGGVAGRILHLHNLGSVGLSIIFANQSASSSAANRIITGTGTTATLGAGQWITLWYDNTTSRWRIW